MNTKIPKTLLPHLFKEEVYRIHPKEVTKPVASDSPEPEVIQEQKEIAVVISDSNQPLELLEKIMSSVNLKMEDVDVLIEIPSPNTYSRLLAFGIETQPSYEGMNDGDCIVLHADRLDHISEDVNLKKKLWAALKALFL